MSTDRFSATLAAGRSSLVTHAMSYPAAERRGRTHRMPPHRVPRTAPVLVGLIAEIADPTPLHRHRDHADRDLVREYKRAGARLRRQAREGYDANHRRYTAWLDVDRTKSTATPKRPRRGPGGAQ